ncbi:hypothetical protein PF005_g4474 [Phytophthora fragariae]|uniref:Uncharacterized protein n=1 Tax=Phytophthora fragariae TaxID=53985 RepID=A0A6A3S7B8_9STRA|nr:hypothetical protein PF003_g12308 [Phytophthora fragariae]KAE8932939.1 hypothetical protein PF009_g17046 [Phytophthora fragariae]KAE8986440.1 hypothetical protein PF011_g19989 [Phytophthora fragariae]KAE9084888.1 hypothetical protein PF010_g20665 [Phytophthora fragariae]KAE9085157.1 hypothetical protein PF007_g21248 [Phytophthora fragariae]
MGCRLVTPKDAVEPTEQRKADTERPSSVEDLEPGDLEPEAEAVETNSTKHKSLHDRGLELSSSSSSLSVVPLTVTSQISDIVDMCEGMKDEDVRAKSEAVLERILRAQYRVDQVGAEAPHRTVELLSETYAHFQEVVAEYAGKQETDATVDALEEVDGRLDLVNGQLDDS